ncbi:tripartite tricarboxylate transporter substrate binding protein [Roseomonas terrae]|uniref:Tripartite tricarboxylate transporter substrate binding protein n=1 Tax=Neoroseomonas terrae TaxID=424799 RepID=A0ABS5EIP3_9PROT|nr:tripartite tricarboxylate transporter substrate binding protein [Neoroseomonas terrae]MBR0650898.1 tripartite tricarboxylate transporter substrate binding protein [Neoroseomonas terrae]
MTVRLSRRVLGATLLAPALARAQEVWPTRQVVLVVPYPPGGSTDNVARPLMQEWSKIIGQTIIIENRGGAGGTIGAEYVVRSRPDGYTLLLFPTAIFTISPTMMRPPYDTDKDLVPIARAAASDAFVVVNPNVPVRSIQELVAYAKAHPGTLRFGSAGNGTITQLQCEIFGDHAGVRLEHVPYRGSGLAVNDLVAGHIQMMCDPATLPMVRQGQLRPLATFGEQRHPEFPNVPTLMESGLADRGAMSWFGIAAPAGTPLPVRERIAATLEQALKSEDVARGLALGGLRPAFEQGEAFANRITGDRAIFAEIIRRTGAGVN